MLELLHSKTLHIIPPISRQRADARMEAILFIGLFYIDGNRTVRTQLGMSNLGPIVKRQERVCHPKTPFLLVAGSIPPWSRHLVPGHACSRHPHPACNMQTRSGEAPELAARNAPRAGGFSAGTHRRGPRTGILQAARIHGIPQAPAKSPGEPARNTYVIPRRQVDDKKKRRCPIGGCRRFCR